MTTQDPGDKSRRLMRTSLATSAAVTVVSLIFEMIPNLNVNLMAGVPNWPIAITPAILGGIAGCIVWIVGFIASMTYMAHQARRLPDASLNIKAKRYRWMLPVVSVVGLIACWIGPLVAFIIYIGFIDEWRRRLKTLSKSIMQDDLGPAQVS